MQQPRAQRRRTASALVLALLGALAAHALAHAQTPDPSEGARRAAVVGSKGFTESVILGELAVQALRAGGASAEHRAELGGTQILFRALERGDIDVYPEYTGTIRQEILGAERVPDDAQLQAALAARGLRLTRPLGFNNTYAVGMLEPRARELGITRISQLRDHPQLRLRFTSEFMSRADGWPALRGTYALPQRDVQGLDHDLAYRGLASGDLDATDLYSTDAEIEYYGIRILEDDLGCFPRYDAVYLYRADLEQSAPAAIARLRALEGALAQTAMIDANARAKLRGERESAIAASLAQRVLGPDAAVGVAPGPGLTVRIARTTLDHLRLVAISLSAAVLVAVPLGIACAQRRRLGAVVLTAAGIVQTVPALALLVVMIPLLGIGSPPAIAALFLYSLLPILRNTVTGLQQIPDAIRESAEALGLSRGARLRLIELPLAARTILAGIKTSAVINVGTATLGALIGAGGYGQPILTGIRLDSTALILEGAVPAAALALLVQGCFELAERRVVPRGLRLQRAAPADPDNLPG